MSSRYCPLEDCWYALNRHSCSLCDGPETTFDISPPPKTKLSPKYCPTLKKYIPTSEFYCHECEECERLYTVPHSALAWWDPSLSKEENAANARFYKNNEEACRFGFDASGRLPKKHDSMRYWSPNADVTKEKSEEKNEEKNAPRISDDIKWKPNHFYKYTANPKK